MQKYLFGLLVLGILMGCSSEDSFTSINEEEKGFVMQERRKDLPNVKQGNMLLLGSKTKAESLPADSYLGRAYRIGNTIMGDVENVGFGVIDIARLKKDNPNYVLSDFLRFSYSSTSAYSTFARFEERSEITKKVSKGFSLNLGLFKLGRKKIIREKFSSHVVQEQESAFGEIEIEVRHKKHELQTLSNVKKKIAANYLYPEFMEALYNVPIQNIIDEYGLFVIAKYYSGGRASGLVYGTTQKLADEETREKNMQKIVDASYSWKSNSVSGNLEFAPGSVTTIITNNSFNDAYYCVSTQGGSYDYQVNTPANDLKSGALDLSGWLHSLNDENTHVLTGFLDEGLHPISDFILEENFRQRINDTHNEFISSERFIEPFIEIMKVYVKTVGGEKLYKVAPILNTRQGDLLILNDGLGNMTDEDLRANNDTKIFTQRADSILKDKSRYYQCLIKAEPSKILTPILRVPLNFDLSKLDESRLNKFQNMETGMWYIYDSVAKIAFAYYMDEYIPEVYGMLDWINTIPEKKISMASLYQFYRIFGL